MPRGIRTEGFGYAVTAVHSPGNGVAVDAGGVRGQRCGRCAGGVIGLGGAEFRLPLLIALFGFAGFQAVIVNKLI